MKKQKPKYSLLIQWSNEDKCYVVAAPEWEGLVLMPFTDGKTYKQAAKHGQQVLEMLIAIRHRDGQSLPLPKTYA